MIYTVDRDGEGRRLDQYLSELTELSRSAAARLIEDGCVFVSGIAVSKKYRTRAGDEIEVELPEPEEYDAEPENIPLDTVYEDGDIIVINKPQGMVVHPAPGNYSGTLVNALLYHCRDSLSGIGGVMRPGIVHRIDKDTSGLLVVAKNDFAHKALSEELSYHGIEREYHALVRGGFKQDGGRVDLPIGRHPKDRKRMAVREGDPSAREAVTNYRVLERFGAVSYLELKLETGRTHQIRVHMSTLGHPLLGDVTYGGGGSPIEKKHSALLAGQALHARRLSLTHPRSGERMTFECPLPENFARLLEILRKQAEE